MVLRDHAFQGQTAFSPLLGLRGSVPSLRVPGPFQIKTEAYLVWEEGIGCRWTRKKRDPEVGSLLLERGAGGLWLMPEGGRKSEVLVLGQG